MPTKWNGKLKTALAIAAFVLQFVVILVAVIGTYWRTQISIEVIKANQTALVEKIEKNNKDTDRRLERIEDLYFQGGNTNAP